MSLCVAWKFVHGGVVNIGFAADSCVTMQSKEGSLEMPHGGVKVLALPVRIIPPTGMDELPFERVYGMAFVDGFLPAFLLKESLGEALEHLQVAGIPSQVSFTRICDFVLKFHKHTHHQLREHLKSGFEVSFFFGGLCPATGRIRIAKFFVDFDTEEPTYQEILQGGGVSYDTLGLEAAQDRFRKLFDLNLAAPPCRVEYAVWRRLREVLHDPRIPFVKGVVQHGKFDDAGNFAFAGTMDLEFVDGQLRPRTFVRGVDIEAVHQAQAVGDLSVAYPYAFPFNEDVQAFAPQHFWNEDGSGVVIDEPITVVPSEETWARDYDSEQALLAVMLNGKAMGFEHIGSTAVTGVAARPVIDILIGIQAVDNPQQPPFDLRIRGFEYFGDCGIPRRLVYRKRQGEMFDLHIVEHGGDFWTGGIRFRQYLLDHPDEARRFGLEKVRILNVGAWTANRYLAERGNYFGALMNKASA